MGREIRRVPPTWEHPKNEYGQYQPLYDTAYEPKAQEWLANVLAWEAGTHPDQLEDPELLTKYRHFWEWDGGPPAPEYHRPDWPPETQTAYQIYETVTEGTPVSPVFATQEAMRIWLQAEGYSERAIEGFMGSGWVPSMVLVGGQMASGIAAYDLLPAPEKGA